MVDGTKEYGKFHEKAKEQYEQAPTEGQFDMVTTRIKKINIAMDSIIDYQKYERD